jgi:hypothetical protein
MPFGHGHILVGDYAVWRDVRIIRYGYDRNRTRIDGAPLERHGV